MTDTKKTDDEAEIGHIPDENDLAHLEFRGWWEEAEKEDSPEPWERFQIALFGIEAGDFTTGYPEINQALRASGYELVLRRSRGDVT